MNERPKRRPEQQPQTRQKAPPASGAMRAANVAFSGVYLLVVVLFAVCALALIGLAGITIWHAIDLSSDAESNARLQDLLEGIGLLTIAVASLELSQTVLEEEVKREASMSTPTRARRFLSRFLLVVVVSLAVEFLVLTFELIHSDPSQLPYAAALGVGAAALLIGWAMFVRSNAAAEALEPEAMEDVKREDEQVS